MLSFAPIYSSRTILIGSFCCLVLAACSAKNPPTDRVTLTDVLDPITFRTDQGQTIRLVGTRAPSVMNPVECFGKESLKAAESLIGKTVRLEVEPLLPVAQDGAYPRYVWLEVPKPPSSGSGSTASGAIVQTGSGTVEKNDEVLVNEKAIEMGAVFPFVSKEMTYGERMLSAARYASATNKGLWGACVVESKETTQGSWLTLPPEKDCVIKAKMTDAGKKIYRTPDCPAYGETLVLESKGGRWFCAEDTAKDAGYERASDCP